MNDWKLGDASGTRNVVVNGNIATFNYPCSDYHTCTYYYSTLPSGYYKLEVWGAQGGGCYVNAIETRGYYWDPQGMGGYSVGVIKLEKPSTVYVYVGGRGEEPRNPSTTTARGGFNGGGDGPLAYNPSNDFANDDGAGGGGGASDIRINDNKYINRVIVAGGGGGNGYNVGNYKKYNVGYGGGISAGPPYENSNYGFGTTANQTNGFSLGQGEDGKSYGGAASGGGGGGYMGGFTAHKDYGGGGGGSGYIGGVISYEGITKNSIPGNSTIVQVNGNTRQGNSGHGAARITFLKYLGYTVSLTSAFEKIYEPGSTISIDIQLSTISTEEQATINRSIDGSLPTNIHKHDDDGKPYKYTDRFPLPTSPGYHTINYSVISKSGDISNASSTILVTKTPTIRFIETPKSKLIYNETIVYCLEVFDDTKVTITISDCCGVQKSVDVTCSDQTQIVNISFTIPYKSPGQVANLYICANDEFAISSEPLSHNFTIVENIPPSIKIDKNLSYVLSPFHNILINGHVMDEDSNTSLCIKTIFDKGNDTDHHCIDVNTTSFYPFFVSIPAKNIKNGIHRLKIYCVDDHETPSNIIEQQFATDNTMIVLERTPDCRCQVMNYLNTNIVIAFSLI